MLIVRNFYKLTFFLLFISSWESVVPQEIFQTNRSTYASEDKIFFRIHLEQTSFVYILNESSDGTIHLLFPNPDDPDNLFQAGDHQIPRKKANYEFQVDQDVGIEKFYLILSQKKISKLHERNFRDTESLHGPQWLRKLTSDLLPFEWKISEKEVQVVEN
jgi:hypothetical protein